VSRAKLVPIAIVITLALSLAACTPTVTPGQSSSPSSPSSSQGAAKGTTDLSADIKGVPGATAPVDAAFTAAFGGFSAALLNQVASGQDNYLVSPLSVELALAMTANGASGATLDQMLAVLAPGLTLDKLNAILPSYAKGLPTSDNAKFHVANSIWCNNSSAVDIKRDFLQTNANYYGAGTFSTGFDEAGLADMNAWVNSNTDGMIPQLLDQLEPNAAVVLLSALAFDAQWSQQYGAEAIDDGEFTTGAGQKVPAKYMIGAEGTYIDDGLATGFMKPYVGDQYEFVALLPNTGVTMADYLKSLTGGGLMKTLAGARTAYVETVLPEFSFDYSAELVDVLKAMGMKDAFSVPPADFSKIGTIGGEPLAIAKVTHKTTIEVTPVGTRAGAGTGVQGAGAAPDPLEVRLDRPFVFGIVDSATKLPVFLGVMNSPAMG